MKIPLTLLCLLSGVSLVSAQATDAKPNQAMQITTVSIQHISVSSNQSFEATVKAFEAGLGSFDPLAVKDIATASPEEIQRIRQKLETMAGSSGLMRFGAVANHGALLPFVSEPAAKAVQYVLGNPLVAVEMTRYNLAAGLYAPLRAIIYEDQQGTTHLEYDLPSSLFGQFHDAHIDAVAAKLDAEMTALVKQASAR